MTQASFVVGNSRAYTDRWITDTLRRYPCSGQETKNSALSVSKFSGIFRLFGVEGYI